MIDSTAVRAHQQAATANGCGLTAGQTHDGQIVPSRVLLAI
jgi:hypothetical protein